MRLTDGRHRTVGIATMAAALAACGKGPEPAPTPRPAFSARPAPPPAPPKPQRPATKRPPNHAGVAFVAEWHNIRLNPGDKGPLFRSPKQFQGDLERLYTMGFRPVTARNWLAGKMELPKGASPVILTFDDSSGSQFRLRDDGTVDPACGVGVWLDFAKTHPDFPVKGTFFVLPNAMFMQPKWNAAKLKMLREWGSEVANHTMNHVPLRKQSDARVQREIAECAIALTKMGERGPFTLAYPYGSTPHNLKMLRGFPYKNGKITVAAGFLVGANPAKMPTTKGFDRYRIPRIQALKGPFGLDDWLDGVKAGKVKPYVE